MKLTHQPEKYLNDLSQTIYDLLVDLGTIFNLPAETEDLTQIEFFYKKLHRETVFKYTQERMMPYKDQIKEKNIDYFKEHTDLVFAGLEEHRISYYKELILDKNEKTKRLKDDDFDMVWAYLDAMMACVEVYETLVTKSKGEDKSLSKSEKRKK